MSRGVYTLASGLLTTENNLAKATENLVNLETKGFKSSVIESEKFEPYMLQRRKGGRTVPLAECFDGIYSSKVRTDYSLGEIEQTDRGLDFAIVGPGFFKLEGEQNILTREGAFHIDEDGYLAHTSGKRVLGEEGTILMQTDRFTLEDDGMLVSLSGEELGKIALYLAQDDELSRTDNNCFVATNITALELPNGETRLENHALESSNVVRQDELVKTVELSKAHSIYAKMLKLYEEIDERANSQILGQ